VLGLALLACSGGDDSEAYEPTYWGTPPLVVGSAPSPITAGQRRSPSSGPADTRSGRVASSVLPAFCQSSAGVAGADTFCTQATQRGLL
jgi:hypothetical protein